MVKSEEIKRELTPPKGLNWIILKTSLKDQF